VTDKKRQRTGRATGMTVANGTPMARGPILDHETSKAPVGARVLARASIVERVTGIEPALSAWELDKIYSGSGVSHGRLGP
jgi:hypothetical protein